ncbi:hypothetical protein B0H13DRAFT_2305911 [Mycena leptocephala]|nr:hypothetical protein B0H13DRAFT_2305911 [Mycena leptocephala]
MSALFGRAWQRRLVPTNRGSRRLSPPAFRCHLRTHRTHPHPRPHALVPAVPLSRARTPPTPRPRADIDANVDVCPHVRTVSMPTLTRTSHPRPCAPHIADATRRTRTRQVSLRLPTTSPHAPVPAVPPTNAPDPALTSTPTLTPARTSTTPAPTRASPTPRLRARRRPHAPTPRASQPTPAVPLPTHALRSHRQCPRCPHPLACVHSDDGVPLPTPPAPAFTSTTPHWPRPLTHVHSDAAPSLAFTPTSPRLESQQRRRRLARFHSNDEAPLALTLPTPHSTNSVFAPTPPRSRTLAICCPRYKRAWQILRVTPDVIWSTPKFGGVFYPLQYPFSIEADPATSVHKTQEK